MTNKEALAAKVNCPVSDDVLEVALIDRGVNGAASYSASGKQAVELATMDVLYSIFTQPDIVEGGYQLSHPDFYRKITERLTQLATANGADDILAQLNAAPSISSKPVW